MDKNYEEKLIEEAHEIPYTKWDLIDSLIDKAVSVEAKKQLREIQIAKFRAEEHANDSL